MDSINKEKIIDILLERNNIRFAYLFGSQVKNQTRFGSDLDIALFFEYEPGLPDIGALALELEDAAGCKVDLVSMEKLYENNPKLAFSIIDEGDMLFCKDKFLLGHYKKMVFLYYLDFKPVIDLFTNKLFQRLSDYKFAVAEPRTNFQSGRNK